MATVYVQAANIGQLISAVNVQRGLGFKPEGGLTYNGFYGQLMVTGSSQNVYSVVAASDAAKFNAAMSVAITAGRVPLGKPEVLGGNIVQAVGDVSGISSVIVSTDISDSSLIGRQILTAPDAPAVRTLIGATATGNALITAADAAAARTAIGAGTSNLIIGTTSTTAKAGNYAPAAADISDAGTTGRQLLQAATASAARTTLGAGTTGSALFTAATAGAALTTLGFSAFTQTLTAAADAAAYRTLIGAGTSSLALGTTSTTAKRGDYQPAVADISGSGTVGRLVMAAETQADAQTAIGGGAGADGAVWSKTVSGVTYPRVFAGNSSTMLFDGNAGGAMQVYLTDGATPTTVGNLRGAVALSAGGAFSVSATAAFTPLCQFSLITSTYGNTVSTVAHVMTFTGTGTTQTLRANATNVASLGNAGVLWKDVWATNGTIQTSDQRAKEQIAAIPDAVLDAWQDVEFVQFKLKSAVAEKGGEARLHTGVIAQQVRAAFEAHGLDPFAYGLLGYDEWDATPATYREVPDPTEDDPLNMKTVLDHEEIPAGNSYVIRATECAFMEMALMRRELAKLKAK